MSPFIIGLFRIAFAILVIPILLPLMIIEFVMELGGAELGDTAVSPFLNYLSDIIFGNE